DKTDQGYVIKFENGEIVVPEAMVLDFFEEDDQGGFVPKTDREKEKFAKGYVPYRGRWVQISYRERMRKKEKEERRLSMEQAKARRYWRHHATVKTKRFIFLHTLPDRLSSARSRSTSTTTASTSSRSAAPRRASWAGICPRRRICTSTTTARTTATRSMSCSTRATTCSPT
ncbi:MAG: hypothetical protein ACYSUM_16070, partial [Planctomycetota bacterium]